MQPATFAIVGAGFSGSMLAAQLVRQPAPVHVYLIERSGVFGRGLAYGTACADHLLNVRSGRMSAFPDEPDHFVRWLRANRPELADPQGFAPRMIYGDYIQSILAEAGQSVERVVGEAVMVEESERGARVTLSDGRTIEAHAAVLATGNPPPADAAGVGENDRYLPDPWARGALKKIGERDDVLMLGAGLTMIDVVLALAEQGWKGRALALSRRGLLPRPHNATQAYAVARRPEADSLLGMMREVRTRMREIGWGEAMDELRPFNQAAWRNATDKERGRFLRHLRPWWDVHRHRTAPQIGRMVSGLVDAGRLRVAAGRIEMVEPVAEGLAVEWRARGGEKTRVETWGWMVNCTGPLQDLAQSGDTLLTNLFKAGIARVDGASLGLDVMDDCRLQDETGAPHERLYALGPPTRSAFWEVVAVPEIRAQAQELAERLAG